MSVQSYESVRYLYAFQFIEFDSLGFIESSDVVLDENRGLLVRFLVLHDDDDQEEPQDRIFFETFVKGVGLPDKNVF